MKKVLSYLQILMPLRFYSFIEGVIANIKIKPIKNYLIKKFIKINKIDLSRFCIEDINQYQSLNDFFIRKIKPKYFKKSEEDEVSSPAEATIEEWGILHTDLMLQAKNKKFTLNSLFAGDDSQHHFTNGSYMIFFLKPHNYHRFHMPVTGVLEKGIFIPGKQLGVDLTGQKEINDLYGRNERYVTLFKTEIGYMGIVLIGALSVGRIKTVWHDKPLKSHQIIKESYGDFRLNKYDEMGYFQAGSTIIVLFEKNKIKWDEKLKANHEIQLGAPIATFLSKKS